MRPFAWHWSVPDDVVTARTAEVLAAARRRAVAAAALERRRPASYPHVTAAPPDSDGVVEITVRFLTVPIHSRVYARPLSFIDRPAPRPVLPGVA